MGWFKHFRIAARTKQSSRESRASSSRRLQFAELEPRLLLSAYNFDFATKASPIASGYVGVPVVGFNTSQGYGWTDTSNVSAVDRATSDPLTRDFHTAVDRTFQVALPNGDYRVTLTMGDALRIRDGVNVYLNGSRVASNLSTDIGQYMAPSFNVTVNDGKLAIRLTDTGGRTSGWALDAIDIVPASTSMASIASLPTANGGADQSITEGASVSFKGSASGVGPLTYSWNFGDGKSATGTLTPKHVYDDDGKYTAVLTVTDANGSSTQDAAVINVANIAPRPNPLGTYKAAVNQAVRFVGIAKDPSAADLAAGYSYSWNFGDGKTATGPTANHAYASAGTYTVTFTVTDKDGGRRSTTTTAVIGNTTTPKNDFSILSSNLIANTTYGYLTWSDMASTGAWGANADWEQGDASQWHIELQRYGAELIIGGAVHGNTAAIDAGLKAIQWGFDHQTSDGSFKGTADPFHSTSIFVEAAAHSLLVLKQSPLASKYQAQINALVDDVYDAAKWMTGSSVWTTGIKNNAPYTHRRYIVADALALTSKLVGGDSNLMSLARSQINDGMALQWTNGINPELGGCDTSYQVLGIAYAERWVTYYPNDSVTPGVRAMIEKGLAWEATEILGTGEVSTDDCTRTGNETGPSGTTKTVDWKRAVDAFATWYQRTGNKDWQILGRDVAQFYYKQY